MESGFFEYVCDFYDETEQNNLETAYGVIYSDNYSNAVYELQQYYGNINTITITQLEKSNVYDFEIDPSIFSLKVNKEEKTP